MLNKTKKCQYKYYVVRGQPAHCNKTQKKREDENYVKLLKIEDVNNAVNLWNRLKETLKKKVEFCLNNVNLIDIKQEEFVETINKIYDNRKVVNVDSDEDNSDDE